MTQSAAPLRAESTGDGSGLNHPYTWRIDDKTELLVTRVTIADGTETTLTVDVDYTVTGVGSDSFGNVVIDPALSPDYKLIIIPNLEYKQDTDFTNQNSVPPDEIESALDKMSRQIKQIAEVLTRTVTLTIGQSSIDATTFAATMLGYKNDAESAKTAAETAETNAETAESNAQAAATQAQTAVKGALWSGGVTALTNSGSPYTLTDSDAGKYYTVDTSSGSVMINLPSIATAGEPFTIGVEKSTSDANTVTINRNGTDTIDGGTSAVVLSNSDEARVFSSDEDPSPDNWTTASFGLRSGDFVIDNFADGVDFTAGTSTSITLSQAPGSENNVTITFDGVTQHHTEYSVSGTTVTFTSAIPSGVSDIEAKIGRSVEINVPADDSVSTSKIQDGAVTSEKVAPNFGLVPSGSIVAWPTDTAPTGWLECDGSAVSRTTYAALFGVISDDYGNGNGSTTFNLPDYRGEFLRGWANGSANDPDRASRTDRGDGTTGDNVGTKQGYEIQSHTHEALYCKANLGVQSNSGTANDAGLRTTEATGGNETRPRNVNVMYIIKT